MLVDLTRPLKLAQSLGSLVECMNFGYLEEIGERMNSGHLDEAVEHTSSAHLDEFEDSMEQVLGSGTGFESPDELVHQLGCQMSEPFG